MSPPRQAHSISMQHHSCTPSLHSLLNHHTHTRSANTNLLSAPTVRTTFTSCGFSVAAPAVWNSLPSGICDSSSTRNFFKLTASSRPSAPPSDSPKCLRFGHWLTLCTPNIHLLPYLLTKFMDFRPTSRRFILALNSPCKALGSQCLSGCGLDPILCMVLLPADSQATYSRDN